MSKIHTDGTRLIPTPHDLFEFSLMLEAKFNELCELHKREKYFDLQIPEGMKSAFMLWRTMVVRHREALRSTADNSRYPKDSISGPHELADWMLHQGIFKNTLDERRAIEEVAQWMLDQANILRGQPIKKMEFDWTPQPVFKPHEGDVEPEIG